MALRFNNVDVLITPTLPILRLGVGWNAPAHLAGRGPIAWSQYTYLFNLTGQPKLSLCAGRAADGSLIGLQVVGQALGEALVIRVAAAIERATAHSCPVRGGCGISRQSSTRFNMDSRFKSTKLLDLPSRIPPGQQESKEVIVITEL
ncbi:amidase family protein [Methylobacterium sp. CM6247]